MNSSREIGVPCQFYLIDCIKIIVDPLVKLTPKLILINPNFNPNKFWILIKNKILITSNKPYVCNWYKRNKIHKSDSYAAMIREEEKKILQVWYKAYL